MLMTSSSSLQSCRSKISRRCASTICLSITKVASLRHVRWPLCQVYGTWFSDTSGTSRMGHARPLPVRRPIDFPCPIFGFGKQNPATHRTYQKSSVSTVFMIYPFLYYFISSRLLSRANTDAARQDYPTKERRRTS